VAAVYSNVLTGLSLDRRASRFILKNFKNVIEVQLRNYFAVELPLDLRGGDVDLGLESKMLIANSLAVLSSATQESRQKINRQSPFLRNLLQDALAASEIPRIASYSVAVLDHIRGCRRIPDSAPTIFKVSCRALESSNDHSSIYAAVSVIHDMLKQDPSHVTLLQSQRSITSSLLALSVANLSSDVSYALNAASLGLLLLIDPETKESLGDFNWQVDSLGPDKLNLLRERASKDPRTTRRKREFESIFAPGRVSALQQTGRSEDSQDFKQSAEQLAKELGPREVPKAINVNRSPCRKCSRTLCTRIEATPREFKICSQSRFASYCSIGKAF
jgi:hypothetical protein